MGIIQFFIIALIVGVIIYLIQVFAPIPGAIKTVILWAGVIFLVLILLSALGILGLGHDYQIPRLR